MRLQGKVALVTAAGRGIGRGIVLALAREGADIVLNSFSEGSATAVAAEVQALGRRVLAVSGDISAPENVTALVDRSIETMGGIDILVNNVGGGAKTKAEPTHGSLADVVSSWDGTYQLSLRAPVLMSEALAPRFPRTQSGSCHQHRLERRALHWLGAGAFGHLNSGVCRDEDGNQQLYSDSGAQAWALWGNGQLHMSGGRHHRRLAWELPPCHRKVRGISKHDT